MADVDYRADYRGTGELMRTEEMSAAMIAIATDAIPFARQISPDAAPIGVGYVDHFEVSGHIEKIAGARRAVAELANTSDYAVEVEIGQLGDISAADTGHHVLARVADQLNSERG